MALTITHAFVSTKADGNDTSLVRPSNWNANHTITGTVDETMLAFTDITTANVSTSKHGLTPKLPNDSTLFLNGTGAWTAPPGSGGSSFDPTANITFTGFDVFNPGQHTDPEAPVNAVFINPFIASNFSDTFTALNVFVQSPGGTINTVTGIEIQAPNIENIITNAYGLIVGNHSNVGADNAINFWSQGANSVNVLEGKTLFGANGSVTYPLTITQAAVQGSYGFINLGMASATTEVGIEVSNTTADGHKYTLISTGTGSSVGAGKFIIADGTMTTPRLIIDPSGLVGFGEPNPQAPLHISHDTGAATTAPAIRINSVSGSAGCGGSILWTDNGDVLNMAWISGQDDDNWGGRLSFATAPQTNSSPGGTPTVRMSITSAGNVGIGTTTPGHLLEVDGDVLLAGPVYLGTFPACPNAQVTIFQIMDGTSNSSMFDLTAGNSASMSDVTNTVLVTPAGADVTNQLIGLYARNDVDFGTTNLSATIFIDTPQISGTVNAIHGLHVADQTLGGFTAALNIYSQGAASTNVFEGSIKVGGANPGASWDFYSTPLGTPNAGDFSTSINGTAGSTTYTYVVTRSDGSGLGGRESSPSTTITVSNGPDTLDTNNYIVITFPSDGVMYNLYRTGGGTSLGYLTSNTNTPYHDNSPDPINLSQAPTFDRSMGMFAGATSPYRALYNISEDGLIIGANGQFHTVDLRLSNLSQSWEDEVLSVSCLQITNAVNNNLAILGGTYNDFSQFDRLTVHSHGTIFTDATLQSTPGPNGLFNIYPADGGTIPFIVNSNQSSQTADLTRWLAPNQSAIARVTASGQIWGKMFLSSVNTVASGPTPLFDLSLGDIQVFTTNSDVTQSVFNIQAGQTFTMVVIVDAGGPRNWTWDNRIIGGMDISSSDASTINIQSFTCPDGSVIVATGIGVSFPVSL